MRAENMGHIGFLNQVGTADVDHVKKKEATYRGSWKARGGVGAFMMLARKWDRIEGILEARDAGKYDVLRDVGDGSDGTLLAEIRDLRRYLLLVEAEIESQRSGRSERFGVEFATTRPDVDANRRVPRHEEPPTQRLADGVTEEDRVPGVHYVASVHYVAGVDPRSHSSYLMGGGLWYVVDRRRYTTEQTGMLDELDIELNNKEHEETKPEYRGLYEWHGVPCKWILRDEYRERWGKQP